MCVCVWVHACARAGPSNGATREPKRALDKQVLNYVMNVIECCIKVHLPFTWYDKMPHNLCIIECISMKFWLIIV